MVLLMFLDEGDVALACHTRKVIAEVDQVSNDEGLFLAHFGPLHYQLDFSQPLESSKGAQSDLSICM